MTYKPESSGNFARAIQHLLNEKKLTHYRFAKDAELETDYVSKLLNGKIGEPRREQLKKIAKGLGMTEQELGDYADRYEESGVLGNLQDNQSPDNPPESPPSEAIEGNTQEKIIKKLNSAADVQYEKLFGREDFLSRLAEYLHDRDGRWFISVVGAGGMGKSSIVAELVKTQAASAGFQDIAWVTAKRTYFSLEKKAIEQSRLDVNIDTVIDQIASQLEIRLPVEAVARETYLAEKLRSNPYLVVIDNLEDVKDHTDFLQKFNLKLGSHASDFRPTKVVFTSRQKFPINNIFIAEEELSGINQKATLSLVRYQGQPIQCIREALDEELEPIFTATNGIPLLILLVVSIIKNSDLTLDEILDSLSQETDLCNFLYETALSSISPNAQDVLLLMTEFSASHSVARKKLKQATSLAEDTFQKALDECIQASLLTSVRSLSGESRYSIHNLLYEFLRGLDA